MVITKKSVTIKTQPAYRDQFIDHLIGRLFLIGLFIAVYVLFVPGIVSAIQFITDIKSGNFVAKGTVYPSDTLKAIYPSKFLSVETAMPNANLASEDKARSSVADAAKAVKQNEMA